jgi:predicted dehydrogenase
MDKKLKLGILGTSDIAYRRFLPALQQCPPFVYAGVASRTPDKGKRFRESFGGEIYASYDALLADPSIDAVYLPLPPALHYEWAKKALEQGKHVMMEKPFTTTLEHTKELTELARRKGLALHENYMFLYHSQLDFIRGKLGRRGEPGAIGEIRLIRCDFGFPFRGATDFRYDKALGGGALLDCGGYPLKLASLLLGDSARITAAKLNYRPGCAVDIGGSATLVNGDGLTAQISFGMDHDYRCSLEVWGSGGSIGANRIFTAPAGYEPVITVKGEEYKLLPDDSFAKSIQHFKALIEKPEDAPILRQAALLEQLAQAAG